MRIGIGSKHCRTKIFTRIRPWLLAIPAHLIADNATDRRAANRS